MIIYKDTGDESRIIEEYSRVKEKGAKGLDGGHEDQVACRGSVTTEKGGNKHKRQQRTGTRCLIN